METSISEHGSWWISHRNLSGLPPQVLLLVYRGLPSHCDLTRPFLCTGHPCTHFPFCPCEDRIHASLIRATRMITSWVLVHLLLSRDPPNTIRVVSGSPICNHGAQFTPQSSHLIKFLVEEVWIVFHHPALVMHRQEQKNGPANGDRWRNSHKALNSTMARDCQLFLIT